MPFLADSTTTLADDPDVAADGGLIEVDPVEVHPTTWLLTGAVGKALSRER